jgi:3-dehydroquinate synthetase
MSQNFGMVKQSDFDEVYSHLKQCGFEIDLKKFKQNWSLSNLIANLYKDKKVENNNLVFILLNSIGKGMVKRDIDLSEFKKVIQDFL